MVLGQVKPAVVGARVLLQFNGLLCSHCWA